MKRHVSILFLISLFLAYGYAHAYTIDDSGNGSYWGGNISSSSYANRDIVGSYSSFGLDSLSVEFDNQSMMVVIKGPYFSAFTSGQTNNMLPGDLFISTNGWNMDGQAAPYASDTASTGEKWEYVVRLYTGDGQRAYLYEVLYETLNPPAGSGGIRTTNVDNIQPPDTYIYRADQEWRYVPGSDQLWLASSPWKIEGDELRFTVDMSGVPLLNYGDLGFHFAVQCGNDVIEGSLPVPEAATLLSLGFGLLGLMAYAKLGRKFSKV